MTCLLPFHILAHRVALPCNPALNSTTLRCAAPILFSTVQSPVRATNSLRTELRELGLVVAAVVSPSQRIAVHLCIVSPSLRHHLGIVFVASSSSLHPRHHGVPPSSRRLLSSCRRLAIVSSSPRRLVASYSFRCPFVVSSLVCRRFVSTGVAQHNSDQSCVVWETWSYPSCVVSGI